jgi:ubiquinone/menaquinone biosynthesis C-methylase UbiE
MAKDLFSKQAETYARYRPTYPQELFDHILQQVPQRRQAWDCGTGNGQAARVLADHFDEVQASDISDAQLKNAVRRPNIHYYNCPAEQTPFADDSFDLITVATAYHWLDWKKFKAEATRVGRPQAIVAIWAYNLVIAEDEAIHKLIRHFYYDVVKSYWDPERRYVEESYTTVEFDFDPLPSKDFESRVQWSREELVGYLESWSAVQNYIKKNNTSPLDQIREELHNLWPGSNERKNFTFPIFLRMGRV